MTDPRGQFEAHFALPSKSDIEMMKRCWTEDMAHENGSYMCICHHCRQEFMGHKRRITCKTCADIPSVP